MFTIQNPEVRRIAGDLGTQGHSVTSYDLLDVSFDARHAAAVINAVTMSVQAMRQKGEMGDFNEQETFNTRDIKNWARQLAEPVVGRLFTHSQNALENWQVWGVNYYDHGANFDTHCDDVEGTILVIGVQGQREMGMYETEDGYNFADEPYATYQLGEASVMIMDGDANPGHDATCIDPDGAISVVVDVPATLRVALS